MSRVLLGGVWGNQWGRDRVLRGWGSLQGVSLSDLPGCVYQEVGWKKEKEEQANAVPHFLL